MKTSIIKEYTTIAQAPKVKADLAEFKTRYTESDLLNAFRDAADFWGCMAGDIISCTVEGMPAGTDFIENGEEPTHFCITITVDDNFSEIAKIRYYTNMDLTIRLYASSFGETVKLFDIKEFKLA